MRDDIWRLNSDGTIYTDNDGDRVIDLRRVIGKCYDRGWFTNCPARYRFFEGARGTKKSQNMIGYEPLYKIVTDPNRNVLVMRQNDVDNYQTTFTKLLKCMDDLGWNRWFTVHTNPHEIIYNPTGQKIIFRGLNNPTALNGLEFATGFFTDTYIDEAYEVKDQSAFEKLDGSMRGRLPKGTFFQITCCLNPWAPDTWIFTDYFQGRLDDDYDILVNPKTRYMDYVDLDYQGQFGKGLYLHKSTYKANEFRNEETTDPAANAMMQNAPEKFKVMYLGMWGNTTESVYPEFSESLIKQPSSLAGRDDLGRPNMSYASFSIGIDTGLSDGQGRRRSVGRNEDPSVRIKSATTMQLCAITSDYSKMVVIDEYFHSNAKAYNKVNTDNTSHLTQYELAQTCVRYIKKWIHVYGDDQTTSLMKGTINIYVDSADIGFRDALSLECQRQDVWNVRLYASTKLPVQSRVDFEGIMMGYGDFLVSSNCKNLIREIKNARRGERGEAREDDDDHALTAMEYGMQPIIVDLKRYKTFMHN